MTVSMFTSAGIKGASNAELDDAVFGLADGHQALLKDAYITYLANGRRNLAVTKTRGQVSGGGRKPWRQKGTGRARVGSSRNPIWRHGGVAFGPNGNENYNIHINAKANRLAIKQALSNAANEGKIKVIDTLTFKEAKTSQLANLLTKIEAKKHVLIVVEQKTETIMKTARNLQDVYVVQAKYLNVFDLLNADTILFTNAALTIATEWLSANTVSKAKGGKQ